MGISRLFARLFGAAMVSLVPAMLPAALIGMAVHGQPVLFGLGTRDVGKGVQLGKYYLHPGFEGRESFWVAFVVTFVIVEIAGIYYLGIRAHRKRSANS